MNLTSQADFLEIFQIAVTEIKEKELKFTSQRKKKDGSNDHHRDKREFNLSSHGQRRKSSIVIRETKGSSCHHIDKRERVQIAMTETGIAAKPYPKVLHFII